jgi:hypothetical protein
MRIFAVSDLHTDFAENRRRLQQVSSTSYLRDVLVVASDSAIHVFGHSHIDFDQVIEGVRYVHHAFDYPRGEGWTKDPLKQILESVA